MMKLIQRRETALYDILEGQAEVATAAAKAFVEMVKDFGDLPKHAKILDEIEKKGDQLTHDLQNRIANLFITPLDKEDLVRLSQALDDVTDLIEAAAARAELYSLTGPREDLLGSVELLLSIVELTESAVKELRNGFAHSETLMDTLTKIHTTENESDYAFRRALKKLFHEPGIDALEVMKWKEMYDRIEVASDKCESIAAQIGMIVDKYS